MISDQNFSTQEFSTKHWCYCVGSFVVNIMHRVAPSSIFICINFPLFFSPLKRSQKILNLAYVTPGPTRPEYNTEIWISLSAASIRICFKRDVCPRPFSIKIILCVVSGFHFFCCVHNYLLGFSQLWKSASATFVNYSICT